MKSSFYQLHVYNPDTSLTVHFKCKWKDKSTCLAFPMI